LSIFPWQASASGRCTAGAGVPGVASRDALNSSSLTAPAHGQCADRPVDSAGAQGTQENKKTASLKS